MRITKRLSEEGNICEFSATLAPINSEIDFNGYTIVGHFMNVCKTYDKKYNLFFIKFFTYKII